MPIIVDKEKKRRDIIKAAIVVFSRTGYQRSKIKDVADEAGVGKGTVYEYFRSKQELFLEMGEHLFEQYVEIQRKNLELLSPPEEQLRALIISTLEQTTLWAGFAYLTIDIWSEMDRKGEQEIFHRLKAGILENTIDVVAEYIKAGQTRGAFKNLDARLVSHIVLAALDGLIIQLIMKNDAFDLNAMADTLTDVLLNGFGGEDLNM